VLKVGNQRSGKRDSFAGGIGILAAASALCWHGLRKLDGHFRKQFEKKRSEEKKS